MRGHSSKWIYELQSHSIFAGSLPTSPDEGSREQRICIRDSDIIVTTGDEVRLMPIHQQPSAPGKSAYKRLHLPNVDFRMNSLSLNPNGKLLAVTGKHRIAVVALPRDGYARGLDDVVDCRCVEVGQYYHGDPSSPPIAKADWHPWGEAGSTLMVLTLDGVMREYDISLNPEAPQQTVNFFLRQPNARSFVADKQTASAFTINKGLADWGPLTVFVLSNLGNIYAVCPYLPRNALIPADYIKRLDAYVTQKQTHLSKLPFDALNSLNQSLVDQQKQFTNSLCRLLSLQHSNTSPIPHSRLTDLAVRTSKATERTAAVQGPFLLQPAPHELEDTDGGDATDIIYTTLLDGASLPGDGLDIVAIAFQDGKVDVCLDVQKTEAKWTNESSTSVFASKDNPMLLMYESIDIGRDTGNSPGMLTNCPLFLVDPSVPHLFFVYDCYGVRCVSVEKWASSLRKYIARGAGDCALIFQKPIHSEVFKISHSGDHLSPASSVTGMAIYVAVNSELALLVLSGKSQLLVTGLQTRKHRPSSSEKIPVDNFALTPPTQHFAGTERVPKTTPPIPIPMPKSETKAHISLLSLEPLTVKAINGARVNLPELSRSTMTKQSVGDVGPEALRTMTKACDGLRQPLHDIMSATQELLGRIELQEKEHQRQLVKERELVAKFGELQDSSHHLFNDRLMAASQKTEELKKRLEHVKMILLSGSSPALSSAEHAWHSELAQLRRSVMGAEKWDDKSLGHRSSVVKREIEWICEKSLKIRTDSVPDGNFAYTAPRSRTWGTEQINRYVNRLKYLHEELQALQNKTLSLTERLGE